MSVLCIDKTLNIFEFDEEFTMMKKKNNCNQHRTNAFDKMKNPSDYLYKTKMCNKKNCNKIGCNFAHSKEELRPRKCFFGKSCKFLKTGECKLQH
mgnify:CR=1 FL=1